MPKWHDVPEPLRVTVRVDPRTADRMRGLMPRVTTAASPVSSGMRSRRT